MHESVHVNDIDIRYQIHGQGQSFTLIHGSGDNLNVWYNVVPALEPRYRVLTYDVRGHGESRPPKDQEVTIDQLKDDLYGLLKATGMAPTILLGYSMGGDVAVHFTLAHPEMVRALIIANSVIIVPWEPTFQRRLEKILADNEVIVREKGMPGLADYFIEHTFGPGFREKNPQAVARYRDVMVQTDPELYLQFLTRKFAPIPTERLAAITCPTLIVTGTQDPNSGPKAVEAAKNTIPKAELGTVNSGHAAFIEAPEEFKKVVSDFLSRHGL